jgi:hypothetical protein
LRLISARLANLLRTKLRGLNEVYEAFTLTAAPTTPFDSPPAAAPDKAADLSAALAKRRRPIGRYSFRSQIAQKACEPRGLSVGCFLTLW